MNVVPTTSSRSMRQDTKPPQENKTTYSEDEQERRRAAYLKELKKLPINQPSAKAIRPITPHLTDKQFDEFIRLVGIGDCKNLAAPPIYIKDRVHILSLNFWSKDGCPFSQLSYQSTKRAKTDVFSKNAVFGESEALAYASKHWPNRLTEACWDLKGVVLGTIVYPNDKAHEAENPKNICFALNRACCEFEISDQSSLNLLYSIL